MKRVLVRTALIAALFTSVPVAAQPSGYYQNGNSTEGWRGAPSGSGERSNFVQQRIDRGVRDGSLSRREYNRAQTELNRIRRAADRQRYRGSWRANDSRNLQVRLDNLSRQIRWDRADGWRNRGDRYWSRYRTDYDARRYYRDGPQYRERVLTYNDEIYRGSDGRYYCKRSDGTTGLIVGGAGGAVLGNVIDGGGNRLAGTLIGGALGALIGREVDRGNSDYRCR